MNNIITRLGVHAAARPHATAFAILNNGEEIGQEITYGQLQSKVTALAAYLGTKQLFGKRVLLAYQDITAFISAFLACQYCGIVAVPVSYPRGTKQVARLFAIIDDAQASAIMSTADTIAVLRETLPGAIDIIITDDATPSNDITEPTFYEVSFIQYTSGSTGKPKGVVVSAKNLRHNQQLIARTFGCTQDSVILSWLPFHHDMGLIGNILHAIYTGCRCIMMSPLSFMQRPARWLEAISNYNVTHSGGPNFAYDIAVDKIPVEEVSKLDLSSWIVAYNGSEPIRFETLQRFANHFSDAGFEAGALCPCYGLAEATLLVSGNKKQTPPTAIFIERELADGKVILSNEDDEDAIAVVSSGNVAAGMDCRIIGVNGNECSELEEGEICIAGDSVTAGYWARDNKEHFYIIDNKAFLKTGDLGFMYQGSLFVHGRLKEMLIIRGKNFYPYDIEDVAAESSSSVETNGVAVFGVNTPDEGFVVLAEVKRHLLKTIAAEEVISIIDRSIAASFGIAAYDIILTPPLGIPRTTSGKLQRVKCREAYVQNALNVIASKRQLSAVMQKKEKNDELVHDVKNNADHNSIKKYLVNVIESKIGGIGSSLLDESTALTAAGLDSLRAMEVINTVNRDLEINLDAAKIFQANTLSGLINAIENMLWLKRKQPFGTEITI
jgi:acyl-CoA synthetase (AMP-forming)/AMP-acid ligase II/acyl carrier protein